MCPSSATITSFFTFIAGTKAKAAEVNTNFQNFRGHLLPTNTDTTTASDITHDLGASDKRWRTLYLAAQNPNTMFSGPATGVAATPTFRQVAAIDVFNFGNFT